MTLSIPPLAMLVANASCVFKDAGTLGGGGREHFGIGRYVVLHVITPVERRGEGGRG